MTNRRSSPIIGLIVGVIFVVAGSVVGFRIGKPMLDKAKQSTHWPSVQGTIESSEVTQKHDKDGTQYSADISYSYAVNGRTFHSSSIWAGIHYSSSSSGEQYRTVENYPKGKVVPVYYDPEHPEEAVLVPGAVFTSYILYVVGWVFLVLGILMLVSLPWSIMRWLRGG